MPLARWRVSASDIDGFDRSKQFDRYTGPIPPVGEVFLWKVKYLKYLAGTRTKREQLWIGLELVPRANRDEAEYAGYYCLAFRTITENNQGFWVPFLDAIGVSGRDFVTRTVTDQEGIVQKIGRWKNDGTTLILAEMKNGEDAKGEPRRDFSWFKEAPSDVETYSSDDDFDEDDEEYDDDTEDSDDDDDYEEEPAPKSRPSRAQSVAKRSTGGKARARNREDVRGLAAGRTARSKRRNSTDDDDDLPF